MKTMFSARSNTVGTLGCEKLTRMCVFEEKRRIALLNGIAGWHTLSTSTTNVA